MTLRTWPTLMLLVLFTLAGCGVTPLAPVQERVDEISVTSVRRALEELVALGPRYAGDSIKTEFALSFITERLESYGYEVRFEPGEFTIDDVPQVNVIAELRGSEEPNVICEIGAHYDTVEGSPGADDNGSGVIGVLEVARVLAGAPVARTIRFCFFSAEETGLDGSRAHVEQALERTDESIDGILVLEMIGYATDEENSQDAPIRVPVIASLPYTGDFICVVGNFSSGGIGNIFEACADAYTPELPYYSANRIGGFFADAARSDHSPYWEAGLRGIMLTDTANFRNPHYHRESDTVDKINFDFMTAVTRAAAATMLHWAGTVETTE